MKNFALIKEKIQTKIEPILQVHNLKIYEITNFFDFENDVLQILVEDLNQPNKPLDFDDIIKSNDQISIALDEIEDIKESYLLEVASAGVEKIIKDIPSLIKAINAYIHIEFQKHKQNLKNIEGYLKKYNKQDETFEILYFLKGQKKTLQFKFEEAKQIRYAVKF